MSKLRLQNGVEYVLASEEVFERKDNIQYYLAVPTDQSIEEIETYFMDSGNTEVVYIVDDSGETVRSITGYTKYKSIEKTPTKVLIKMGLPDWKEKYEELKAIVDALVAERST